MTRARALVVDDDPLVLKAYQRSLKKSFDLVVASGGAEALQRLEYDEKFDVIICDLMMPSVSGEDVFRRASARSPGLAPKFVFVSGGVFTDRGRRFVEAIDNVVLEKPVSWAELAETVNTIVSQESE